MTCLLERVFRPAAAAFILLSFGIPGPAQEALDLSGTWRFAVDPGDQGLREKWYSGELKGSIHLPGSTDEAGVGGPGPERLGVLTRKHEYIGPAWYSRAFVVPEEWKGREVVLFLERVLWESRAWIDGRPAGPPADSFAAPHVHDLGVLSPGRHVVTLRIDNRMIHHLGLMSHSYGPQTQSRWNGVVGRIELRALPPVGLGLCRLFPERSGRGWKVEVESVLRGKAGDGLELGIRLEDPRSGLTLAESREPWGEGRKGRFALDVPCRVVPWSEFTPRLYRVVLELRRKGMVLDRRDLSMGFREVTTEGNRLLLNGAPVFMRGNLDCIHFPLTGYPSTKKEDWLRIFSIYKEHGLNHVRFHSWCPPEAAFQAADELGIYIQASVGIWINEGREEGLGPGKGEASVDEFAKAEMRRVVDTYGNHPSFLFLALGNELGHSDFKVTGKWIGKIKTYDPRRLYAASTARTITPWCDFNATHAVPGIGWVRQHLESGTDWDYEEKYSRTKVPIIAHEIGQWPVYPDWDLCEKFTGVFRNTRLEKLRERAKAAGIYEQQAEFTRASGALNRILYKDEIESFLRTPSCRGFQLLSMEDFQGQGEAYVGWLDMFWDSKGIVLPQDFRGYCAPRVALARIPKYTWKENEVLSFKVVVRNDGPDDLEEPSVRWSLRTPGKVVVRAGRVRGKDLPKGGVEVIGEVRVPLKGLLEEGRAGAFELVLHLGGKPEKNTYPLWVYPQEDPPLETGNLMVADMLDDKVLAALERGGRVLLFASRLGDPALNPKLAAWRPLYWSLVFFPGQAETLGLLVRAGHPAFDFFPTGDFGNWQWRGICKGGRGFDLTGLVPVGYRPIAQPVPDYHAPRKIGTIFEFRVGKGKLLVCGYNLSGKRCAADPAVRRLRYSLLRYAAGPQFDPPFRIEPEKLREIFPEVRRLKFLPPPDRKKAFLWIDCAGNLGVSWKNVPWKPSLDEVVTPGKGSWRLEGRVGAWRDDHCTAWILGRRGATLVLPVPRGFKGRLYLHFSDWNRNKRLGNIRLKGMRCVFRLGPHGKDPKGVWVALETGPTTAEKGFLEVTLLPARGPNLMLADVVLVEE